MGSRKDSMDTKFEEDMQKALALSMESAALEKFRNSKIEGKKTQKILKMSMYDSPVNELSKNSRILSYKRIMKKFVKLC